MTQITSLPPMALPKSRALTDALTAPVELQVDATLPDELRGQLRSALGDRASRDHVSSQLTVDGYVLRRATSDPDRAARPAPFRWSPRAARRPIGLAAVRSQLRGRYRTPSDAVAGVIGDAIARAEEGRAGSLSRWLAALPFGGRAVVHAEAVNWATHLVAALEWAKLTTLPFSIGHDEWWRDSKGTVALRGRADLRVACNESLSSPAELRSAQTSGLFTMMPGRPTRTTPVELGLSALVSVIAAPPTSTPGRVVGWWPECGRAVIVGVDESLLRSTLEAVLAAVGRLL